MHGSRTCCWRNSRYFQILLASSSNGTESDFLCFFRFFRMFHAILICFAIRRSSLASLEEWPKQLEWL
jgi:hypothetical protein